MPVARPTRRSSLACSSAVRRSCRSRSSSACGERRTKGDVGHQRQRVLAAARPERSGERPMHRTSWSCSATAPRNSTSSAISSALREPAPSSSMAAVRLASPNLPAGIVTAAGLHEQIDLHERHLVRLDQPHRQTVRERPPVDRRQVESRRRTKRGRLRAIGRALGHQVTETSPQSRPRAARRLRSRRLISSPPVPPRARPGDRRGNHLTTAACMSDGLNDV